MNGKEKIQEYCKINIENYMQDSAINLDQKIWALAVLESTELHISCLTYSYQIKVDSTFKLIELDNSCWTYNPNFILPSTGGSCLSRTVVRPDSCLAQIFFPKFGFPFPV